MPLPLKDFQVEDLAFYIANPKCGNLSDPGAMKTPSVCVYGEYLKTIGVRTIWAMPVSLMKKNLEEIFRFTNLTDRDAVIYNGVKAKKEILENGDPYIIIMSFTGFAQEWRKLKEKWPDIKALFVDEFHMGFKGSESKRTKEMYAAFDRWDGGFEYFLPMSGTIIAGRLDSCYPAIKIVEPRYYTNHFNFLMQHAILDENNRPVAWKNHDKLGRIFQNHFIRRTFESVHGVSEDPVFTNEVVDMHPVQREMYEEFEAKAVLELEDMLLTGYTGGVHFIRCRQIMSHPHTFGILKPGELTGKDQLLMIHLEDHLNKKEPFLIYASLVPEQERIVEICATMGFKVALINHTVSGSRRGDIDLAFREGYIDGIVGSSATASVGYNWSHIDHIMEASIDCQDDNFEQGYKRAIRAARKKRLWVSVFEYMKSLDQRLFQIVNTKSANKHKVDASYKKLNLGAKNNPEEVDCSTTIVG